MGLVVSLSFSQATATGGENMRQFRKKYLVNPRLQWQIILGANVLALISVAMLGTLMFYMQSHLGSFTTLLALRQDHPFLAQIAATEAKFFRLCIIVGIVQFVLFNGTALFVSHRIAGPLYRLERHLDDVGGGGDPKDVRFRNGDFYQRLAEACNRVMARMRESRSGKAL
jgi:hypothetical protein